MPGAAPIWLAGAAGIAGVAVLRLGWGREQRSLLANAAGWLLLALSVAAGAAAGGAWGIAVASLPAMAAALLVLGHAGATSPAGRPQREDRITASERPPLDLGRRFFTFLIVLLGLVAALALAVAARGALLALGGSEADANATALFVVPLAWGVLGFVLLIQSARRTQLLTLAACTLPALPFLLLEL
jgi:hypothetical protein